MCVIGLKQICKREQHVLLSELAGWLCYQISPGVFRLLGYIVLYLHYQRRHQIEILMDTRELIQKLHHAVVILERMHPDPGKSVFTCNQVLVKGLVHVPEENETNCRHCSLV